jgi:hypothetical protein
LVIKWVSRKIGAAAPVPRFTAFRLNVAGSGNGLLSDEDEYKGDGDFLSVHHPYEPGSKDDAPDSTALALLGSSDGGIGNIVFLRKSVELLPRTPSVVIAFLIE